MLIRHPHFPDESPDGIVMRLDLGVSKFNLGELLYTQHVADQIDIYPEFQIFLAASLYKYINCDWGDTCEEDWENNDEAVRVGERILAVYIYPKTGEKIWIITEWDRSATTILYPEEY